MLAAEEVATHLPEEEVMNPAPLHMHLICGMGIKWKMDTGKGERSPTPPQERKKPKQTGRDTAEGGREAIKHINIANSGQPSTILDEQTAPE